MQADKVDQSYDSEILIFEKPTQVCVNIKL